MDDDLDRKRRIDLWVGSIRQWENTGIFLRRVTEEERLAAQKYRFEILRDRAVIGRGLLRGILAQYLDIDPLQIQMERGRYGKPYLPQYPGLHFNLSHDEDMFLCGVSFTAEIGVDIEAIVEMDDSKSIAERYFTEQERLLLEDLTGPAYHQGFFRLWTRKESFIKGTGEGLSRELKSFDVSKDRVSSVSTQGTKEETGWMMHSFAPCSGYAAAVSLQGEIPRLQFLPLEAAFKTPLFPQE